MQTAGENSQFPATAAASIAAVHESAFDPKRTLNRLPIFLTCGKTIVGFPTDRARGEEGETIR
jgi:hypothetical protein